MRLAAILMLASAALGADPAPEQLAGEVRDKVLDNARRMPRYTCVETILRTQYHRPAGPASCKPPIAMPGPGPPRGDLMARDRLRLDVAVVDGREIFSWAGARRFETHDVDALVGGGASSSGEFGFFLSSVFGGAPGAFRYTGRRGDFAIYDYNVPAAISNYSYRTYGAARTTGFHGTFSVDPSDGDLRQLVVEAEQFASGDGVCRVQHVMDYGRVKIGGGDFLLPAVSTMDALYRRGMESLNETHYSDCREYVGQSKIRFDNVDAEAGAAAKSALQPLPRKVRLLIGLSKSIDTEVAAAGDPVEGTLLRDVTDKKQRTVAKANDRVRGRILRLRQYMDPSPRWFVTIRFDTIERNGIEQPIALSPLDEGDRSTQRVGGREPPGATQRPEGAGLFIFAERGNFVIDRNFHSEWETR
jgi:hypothetical protein